MKASDLAPELSRETHNLHDLTLKKLSCGSVAIMAHEKQYKERETTVALCLNLPRAEIVKAALEADPAASSGLLSLVDAVAIAVDLIRDDIFHDADAARASVAQARDILEGRLELVRECVRAAKENCGRGA